MDHTLLEKLSERLAGDLYWDSTMRKLYATDASAYKEMPLAVAIPKNNDDIKLLIDFAIDQNTSLIPRTAGTSLAGQVVGGGIIVDVSKYFTGILEVNTEEKWVRVQPGVIRDELNMHLKPYGLYFGPETSTANRAMIGGMIGNNSCGSNSVVYGSTREHLLSVDCFLSDGSFTSFTKESPSSFQEKCQGKNVSGETEQALYQQIWEMLSNPINSDRIDQEFPKKSIERRNTGYAIDLLKESSPFTATATDFNFCKLIAGSEGTLAFITEAKLSLDPLPPKETALLCIHCHSIRESLEANLVALNFSPSACELMDHYILERTKDNRQQRDNRFFINGDPAAILVVELKREEQNVLEKDLQDLQKALGVKNLGYHFSIVTGEDVKKVWTLRKAGLGLLSNIPGDAKPAPVIEDTAVDVNDLPDYIDDFNKILKKHELYCVHYAHAGSGELHLRPILNLKTEEGNRMFKTIANEIAELVKKYKGSLSGEHGDGRLRGEYIPFMIGEANYKLIRDVKNCWDPKHIFNPNKIVDTPPMNTSLRFTPEQKTPEFTSVLDFSNTQGILRAAEQCNGSGDCRKTPLSGGTMCPSFMATRNEKDTTRARANILREVLTHSEKENRFDSEEIKDVLDLCLSCKGCKSECPSNVDMGKLKAEFTHQYYQSNKIPLRTRLISKFATFSKWGSMAPRLHNFAFSNPNISGLIKNFMGIAEERSMPLLANTTLRNWFLKEKAHLHSIAKQGSITKKVYLFCDEFTNYNDVLIGQKSIQLLSRLGYTVEIPNHEESGRTYLSKGMLTKAKKIAETNIGLFKDIISEESPLIGIEPSAILSFRDEYIDLTRGELKSAAKTLAENCLSIEEFIAKEKEAGHIQSEQFTTKKQLVKLHGHCHQKALSSLVPSKQMLSLPKGYKVQLIPSGCCGMAGSFGYEKEHYDLSMKIGEMVLFPTVKMQEENTIIAAPGTSCRHQIKDGTQRIAMHPVEILFDALK